MSDTTNLQQAQSGQAQSGECQSLADDTLLRGEALPLPTDGLPGGSLPTLSGLEILGKLGEGGMGAVYLARQRSLNRLVAVKRIAGGVFAGPEGVAQIRREALALGALHSPNVVQIFDVVEQQGEPCLLMEYVQGGNLLEYSRRRSLGFREAALIVETLARAMHQAHLQGIVHLDLKPENVLLGADGVPKIADFGVAKQLDQQAAGQTGRIVMGTLEYMSPEQALAQGRGIGPAADVYGLGAILYRLLSGRPPFVRPPQLEGLALLQCAAQSEPPTLRGQHAAVPRDLQTICMKCLRKEPGQRYASAEALADDLGCYLDNRPIQARPIGWLARGWKLARRHPGKVLGAAAALALVVTVGLVLWQGARSRRLLEQENAADLAAVASHLAGGRYRPAADLVDRAQARLEAAPALAEHGERWRRLHNVAHFFLQAEQAWFGSGEERYEEAKAACEKALGFVGVLSERGEFLSGWIDGLSSGELPADQAQRLHEEVYRQLLLLVYLRTVGWLNERDLRKPEAIAGYQSAWTALTHALEFERRGRLPPALTVGVFARALRAVFHRCNVPAPPVSAEDEARFALKPEQPPAIDLFFSGTVHYYLAEAVPLAPARMVLLASLGGDLDLVDSAQTAEDQLREAIRLDPSQYWHHFVLGRVLLSRKKFAQAEDVFTACIALRPDYPVSHQFRALAICHLAQELPASAARRRQALIERAGKDAEHALELARRTHNPAVYWARGDMYAVLGDDGRALEAYAEGLEADPQLGQRVSRSKVLGRVERYAARLAASSKTPAGAVADAEAVLALVHLARGDVTKAQESAARALQAAPEHARARQIMERVRAQAAGN